MPHSTRPSDAERPGVRRSDAEQNRERIVAAARTAFARPDADASMAEISRQAGVGMATLYRNFPGKRELLEAVYANEVEDVCRAAERPVDGAAGDAFVAWLRAFSLFIASKRHVASALLEHTDRGNPVFGGSRRRVTASALPLFEAAQRAGQIRSDLSLDQVLDMIHAVAIINGDSTYVEPILQSVLSGLRVTPLP